MLSSEDIAPLTIRPLKRVEYDQLVDRGFLIDEKVELLHGALVMMSPQKPRHAETTDRIEDWLRSVARRARVRVQKPLAASEDSEPEPDIAVVPRADYSTFHPSKALLIVEVSDSSLRLDRKVKTAIYAAAGVPEYWVVNLRKDVIEVFWSPSRGRYLNSRTLGLRDWIAPPFAPKARIRVRRLIAGRAE
jgi:Uma2 family endonuclease